MRRSILLLLTCLLALATGVALLGAGFLMAVPIAPAGPGASAAAAAANSALVHRFYAAVNATISTGDAAPLTDLLAADFADRAAPPGREPTRADFVNHLLAVRADFPALTMAVEDVQAHGDWVLARVQVAGAARGRFLGEPVARVPGGWSGLDILRIADGRIAERWVAGDRPALPQSLVRLPLPSSPAPAVLRLARLTVAPGARLHEAALRGPLLLTVESGALTVTAFGGAVLMRGETGSMGNLPLAAVPPGGAAALLPGDGMMLPAGAGVGRGPGAGGDPAP